MSTYDCADCGLRPAVVFLPEGRYLCRPCWNELRELRSRIVAEMAKRPRISKLVVR